MKLLLSTVLSLLLFVPTATAQWTNETIASGLNNPRHLHVGSDGSIYVALSGGGGDRLIVNASIDGQPGRDGCLSEDAGSIVQIDGTKNSSVAIDFPSFSAASQDVTCPGPGFAGIGPADVLFEDGTLTVVMQVGGGQEQQDLLGPMFGTIQIVSKDGNVSTFADLVAYEVANDPDGDEIDSNPYGLARAPDGSLLVADAGGNDVLRIGSDGSIETLAVIGRLEALPYVEPSCGANVTGLPPPGTPIPAQSVPTDVAVGPDGAYYVSTLSGFPFSVDTAKVYRIDPATMNMTVFADGLNHVVGIDFGPDGSLYIAQITDGSLLEIQLCQNPDALPGSVIRIMPDGTKEVLGQFFLPGGIAVDDSTGDVYVTTGSTSPDAGAVLKLTSVPRSNTTISPKPQAPTAAPTAAPTPRSNTTISPKPQAPTAAPTAAPTPRSSSVAAPSPPFAVPVPTPQSPPVAGPTSLAAPVTATTASHVVLLMMTTILSILLIY